MATILTAGGAVVCERCAVADTFASRLRGLLGRDALPADEGLLLRRCGAIHMLFMRFAVDAVFLDGEGRVLRVAAGLKPWRAARCRGARSVLELPVDSAAVRPGDLLRFA